MEEREKRTYEFLDNLGVPYEKYEHEAIMTIEAAEELDKKMGLEICKNLFLSTRHSTEFLPSSYGGLKKIQYGKGIQADKRTQNDICRR